MNIPINDLTHFPAAHALSRLSLVRNLEAAQAQPFNKGGI